MGSKCWEGSEEASESSESVEEGRLSRASNWSRLCGFSDRKMRRKASKSTSSSSAEALLFALNTQHGKPTKAELFNELSLYVYGINMRDVQAKGQNDMQLQPRLAWGAEQP